MLNNYTLGSSHYSRGYKAHGWDTIEAHYHEYFIKMAELVMHIRQSHLSERLYGLTSMHKLIISNNELINFRMEALHIEFNQQNSTWSFIYYAKPLEDPEFVRTYDADKGIEKLDQFIEWIHW